MDRTVICMKWGTLYDAQYVNVLYSAVRKNLTGAFRFVCLTDNAAGIRAEVETYPIPDIGLTHENWYHGAWPKIAVFKRDLYNITGKVLFIDLDMIICGPLDDMFTFSDQFVAINEGIWNDGVPSLMSSIFCFQAGKYDDIVTDLTNNLEDYTAKFNIEQNYLHNVISDKTFWPSEWLVSFKRHLRQPLGIDLFKAPKKPPNHAKIVVFHGKPRPIDLIKNGKGNRDLFPHSVRKPVNWARKYWIEHGGTP